MIFYSRRFFFFKLITILTSANSIFFELLEINRKKKGHLSNISKKEADFYVKLNGKDLAG